MEVRTEGPQASVDVERRRVTARGQAKRPIKTVRSRQVTVKVKGRNVAREVRPKRDGYVWVEGPPAGKPVTEADFEGQPVPAFIRGTEPERERDTAAVTPEAAHGYSAQDIVDGEVGGDRPLQTRLERERRITLIRLNKMVRQRFAYQRGGQVEFPAALGERYAKELSTDGDRWATLPASGDGQKVIVVPKVIADRWTAQLAPRGRGRQAATMVTRQFIRTVLPFSATWHLGNVVDLYLRLVTNGQVLLQNAGAFKALDRAMADLDPHLRDELVGPLSGHFGTRQTIQRVRLRDITADTKAQAFGDFLSAVRDGPGVKHGADAFARATDVMFDIGSAVEARLVHAAAGKQAKAFAKALRVAVEDHAEMARLLARELADDPAALEAFQRATLEMVGDYVTKSPHTRIFTNAAMPFLAWLKAATKFVYLTLPKDHPYARSLWLLGATATREQRAQLGLSYFITEEEAKRLGLPKPRRGYLSGGIDLGDGTVLPTAPFTSFGEAGRIPEALDDGVRLVVEGRPAKGAVHASEAVTDKVLQYVQRPVRQGLKAGGEKAAQEAAEGFIPGAKQARRALEQGGIPQRKSTVLHPKSGGRKGGASTATAILGLTVPTHVDEFYVPVEERRERLARARRKAGKGFWIEDDLSGRRIYVHPNGTVVGEGYDAGMRGPVHVRRRRP